MNKQEVIKEIKTYKSEYDSNSRDVWCYEKGFEDARSSALNSINKLDEPEKPVVPQFVADWYESIKDNIENEIYDLCVQFGNGESELDKDILFWFDNSKNEPIQTLVKMKLYSYEVEKEKMYRARHRLTGEYLSQNYTKTGYYHGLDHFHILKLSKKDWEELGVLDNKMYEIEEAEE